MDKTSDVNEREGLDAPDGSVDIVELLRATRRSVVPRLIEYRTTDRRVVDAVRLLDDAANEIERLLLAKAKTDYDPLDSSNTKGQP